MQGVSLALCVTFAWSLRVPSRMPSSPRSRSSRVGTATVDVGTVSAPRNVTLEPLSARRNATFEPFASEALGAGGGKSEFDWFDHWYPVHVVETMDGTRPHKVQLLGMNLVLWNDGEHRNGAKLAGAWNAFQDSCPHRRAPLSEGRVEADGSLLCSYHGWRYDGTGACSSLPYSPERSEARHRAAAHCEVFPTREADGMVWVFPVSGLPGLMRSDSRDLPLVSELHDDESDEWEWRIPAGVRDFPCGFDTMLENTLDPAHFCAAHHGTLGDRYEDPRVFAFRTTRKLDAQLGFSLDGDMGSLEFVPPCLVKYRPNYKAMPFEGNLILATYCVPTAPGKVRPLANVLRKRDAPFGNTLSERALSLFMGPLTPTWFGHIASSIVLHQDAGLLYDQFRTMRSMGYEPTKPDSKTYDQICYMPNSVDKGIVTFRRWLQVHAGGGVDWKCDDVLPPRGSEDIFDVYHAHTKHCKYCTNAHANLRLAKNAAAATASLALLAPEQPHAAPVAVAAAALALGLDKFNTLFRRYEFNHADND